MTVDEPLLDADRIRALLVELGRRLDEEGLRARIFVVGGAAMALAFSTRRATRDIDAVFEPKTAVYTEAAKMAEEHGLPADWLNDGVKGLLPDRVPTQVGTQFDATGLAVEVASADYLFAMKAMAARAEVDADDLKVLARHLGFRDAEEAVQLVERYYSPLHLKPVTRYLLEDVIAEIRHEDG